MFQQSLEMIDRVYFSTIKHLAICSKVYTVYMLSDLKRYPGLSEIDTCIKRCSITKLLSTLNMSAIGFRAHV